MEFVHKVFDPNMSLWPFIMLWGPVYFCSVNWIWQHVLATRWSAIAKHRWMVVAFFGGPLVLPIFLCVFARTPKVSFEQDQAVRDTAEEAIRLTFGHRTTLERVRDWRRQLFWIAFLSFVWVVLAYLAIVLPFGTLMQ